MRVKKDQIADAIGSKTTRVSAIENGATASNTELAQIAFCLRTPVNELFPNQERDWREIEQLRQYIEIQQGVNVSDALEQVEEHNKLQDDISRQRAEKQKLANHLKTIQSQHQAKLRQHEELEDLLTKNRILRELNFPPEFHAAGITILQGFVKLIKRKYGDTSIGVTIKQSGSKVVLIITTPDGKVEEVEEFLDQYTDVVRGSRAIATLSDDPIIILELKGQLDIARSQYQQQRDINLLLKDSHESRIQGLESHLEWFKNSLALSMESSRHVLRDVISRLESQDQHVAQLAEKLVNIVVTQEAANANLPRIEEMRIQASTPKSGTKPKEADSTIHELNKIVAKEGIGKGLADAIGKLIAWATTRLLG